MDNRGVRMFQAFGYWGSVAKIRVKRKEWWGKKGEVIGERGRSSCFARLFPSLPPATIRTPAWNRLVFKDFTEIALVLAMIQWTVFSRRCYTRKVFINVWQHGDIFKLVSQNYTVNQGTHNRTCNFFTFFCWFLNFSANQRQNTARENVWHFSAGFQNFSACGYLDNHTHTLLASYLSTSTCSSAKKRDLLVTQRYWSLHLSRADHTKSYSRDNLYEVILPYSLHCRTAGPRCFMGLL